MNGNRYAFTELSKQQLDLLEHYVQLLLESNERVNLISRKDTGEVWTRHILHSLSIAKVVQFKSGQHILDVGTGGGLPGIPMAIMFPNAQFKLVDSVGKKIREVSGMIDVLGLKNASAINARVETLTQKFDYIISRAVTALPDFVKMTAKQHKPAKTLETGGIVYIKGGDFLEELKTIGKPHRIWNIPDFFEDPFFETKKVVWIST